MVRFLTVPEESLFLRGWFVVGHATKYTPMKRALLCAAFALFVGSHAFAQVTWNGGTGNWNTGTNWSNQEVPTNSSNLQINSGTAQLTTGVGYYNTLEIGNLTGQTGGLSVSGGTLYGGAVTLAANSDATATLSGGVWEITSLFRVGSAGSGSINITGGTLTTVETWVATSLFNQAEIDGTITVDSGGTWNNSGILSLGDLGRADLNINGGAVTSQSVRTGYGQPGDGRITISNNGSLKVGLNVSTPSYLPGTLEIGFFGKGSLTLNSGTVTSGSSYIGGSYLGAPGEGIVTMHDGTWSNTILHVGASGKGTLTADGGAITSQSGILGLLASGDGTVTLSDGATWTIAGGTFPMSLVVGQMGKGTLTVDGGTLTNGQSTIGLISGSNGSVTVNDGRWVNQGLMVIGGSGIGSLTINGVDTPILPSGQPVPAALEYGEVQAQSILIGDQAGSVGTLSLTGGQISNVTDSFSLLAMTIGLSGTGKLEMSGGTVDVAAIMAGYNVGGTGTLEVSGGLLKYGSHGFTLGHLGTGILTVSGGIVTAIATPVIDSNPTPTDESGYTYFGGLVTLGSEVNSSGTVNLEGGTLAISALTVGKAGEGELNVSGGVLTAGGNYNVFSQTNDRYPTAIVLGDATTGEGTMNVSGGTVYTNSLTIGDEGKGTLNMEGGQITLSPMVSTGSTTLAAGNGSQGTVTMTAGTWNTGDLLVGQHGLGMFDLEGGIVTASSIKLGDGSSGEGTLNISDATLNNNGAFIIGDGGKGTVTITDSDVTAASIVLGSAAPSRENTLTINSGTLDVVGNISVGGAGAGLFQINGGDVTSASATIGSQPSSSGTVDLFGGSWTISDSLNVRGTEGATLNVSGGELDAKNVYVGGTGGAVANLSSGSWISEHLEVGNYGNGTLNVTGGTLSTDEFILGYEHQGTLNLTGGTITVGGGSGKLELGTGSGGVGILNLGTGSTVGTLDADEIHGDSAGTGYVNFNHTGTVTFDQLLTGNLSIYKRGPGTSVLTGQNTYSGGTGIVGGTLEVAVGGAINHGSSDLYIGEDSGSNGTLHVSGGDVTNRDTRLGAHANGTGTGRITAGNWATNNDLFVGYSGTGYLSVEGGSLISFNSYIGESSGSQGTATATGGEWNTALDLIVGRSGTGSLTVNGGTVTATDVYVGKNSGVTGTATVTSGSLIAYEDLTVGDQGTGTFTVNGGTVNVGGDSSPGGGDTYVGRNVGGSGTVTVSSGTLNNDRTLYVGHAGAGTVNISGTGTALNQNAYLGYSTASTGTANVTGGTWTTDGELMVGRYGQGTLNISGGVVNSDTAQIGYFRGDPPIAPVTSTATVSGGVWNSESLTVGYYGQGVLNVTGTGVVSVDGGEGTLMLGREVSSSGTLNIGTGGAAGTIDAAIIRGGRDSFNYGTSIINLNHTGTTTVDAQILGRITLNKLGSGLSILAGDNAYLSGTNIRNGTLQVASTGSINHSAASINVGLQNGDNGALVLDGGTINVDSTFLGSVAGSSGSATVNGGTWTNTTYLYIGSSGTGSLLINDGLVSSLVSYVGSLGTGTATVSDGEWRNRDLNVGMGNTGTVTIDGGLVKTTQDTNIAGTNNTGTIEIQSGTLETTGLTIGSNGTGHFNVNGGTVTTSVTRFGYNGAGNGVANVTAGTWTNSSDMYLGVGGQGTLNITGGVVTVNGTTTLALDTSSQGRIVLGGVEGNRGVLATTQITKGPGFGLLTFEGGVLRAISNQSALIHSSVGSVELAEAGGYFDSNGYDAGLTNIFYGAGAFNKIGAGTLTVSGNSSYAGGTVVEEGTLRVAHNNALGSGTVTVKNGGTLAINVQTNPLNEIRLSGGTYSRSLNLGNSLVGSIKSTSDFEGGIDTTVNILAGINSQNGATISASFSDTPSHSIGNDARRVSDILSLEGVSIVFGQRTDLFVLELQIASLDEGTYLGWLNSSGLWVNAVDGNIGNNATTAQQGVNLDFDAFRNLYGGDLANYIGAWGYTSTGAWAVLNHNSEFALVNDAVPEPSSASLLLVAGAALATLRRRRA